MQSLCRIGSDHIEYLLDLLGSVHVTGVEHEECLLEQTCFAEGIPGIHNGVVSDGYIDASCQHFISPGNAARLRITAHSALQKEICRRIDDHIHIGFRQISD